MFTFFFFHQLEMKKFVEKNIFLTSYQEQADVQISEMKDTIEELRNENSELRFGIDELTARNISDMDEKQAEIDELRKESKIRRREFAKKVKEKQNEILELSGRYDAILNKYSTLREAQQNQQTECQIVKNGLENLKDFSMKRAFRFPCIGRRRREMKLEQIENLLEHVNAAVDVTFEIEHFIESLI